MADTFNDSDFDDAQDLGDLVLDDTNFPNASDGFDLQGSVGFDLDPVWNGPRVWISRDGAAPRSTTLFFYEPEYDSTELPSNDPIDYFRFDPNGVTEIEVNFRIFEDQDSFSSLVVVPSSGVSNVAGHIVYNTSAPEDDPNDEATVFDPDAYPSFKAREDLFVSAYAIGQDLNGVEDRVQHYALDPVGGEATATWTLTGEPVTFAVFGFNGDTDISGANPEDIPRNTITGDLLSISYLDFVVLEEADYRIRIFGTDGTLPIIDPDPAPNPDPDPDPVPDPDPDPDPVPDPDPDPPIDLDPAPERDCVPATPQFDNGISVSGSVFHNDFETPECIIGTGALDVYNTFAPRNEISVTRYADGVIELEDQIFPGVYDQLSGVERIDFVDGVLAFDTDGNAGETYRLYQAAFDRTPDAEGLGFWIDNYDVGNVNLVEMAEFFMNSEEFAQRYGAPGTLDDFSFLTVLYENVLNRTPDQAGFDFWSDQQDAGIERADMLQYFSESTENYGNVAGDIVDGIWYV